MQTPGLDDVMLAIGRLEGKVDTGFGAINQRLDTVNSRLNKHDDKISGLQSFQDKLVGKQTALSAAAGIVFGLVGAWISRGGPML